MGNFDILKTLIVDPVDNYLFQISETLKQPIGSGSPLEICPGRLGSTTPMPKVTRGLVGDLRSDISWGFSNIQQPKHQMVSSLVHQEWGFT